MKQEKNLLDGEKILFLLFLSVVKVTERGAFCAAKPPIQYIIINYQLPIREIERFYDVAGKVLLVCSDMRVYPHGRGHHVPVLFQVLPNES